jgi:hypothetical protein
MDIITIIILVGIGVAKWLVYTALLWGMIRVQSLNYNWLGLLGSSFLGTGLTYIPVVGPYIGWAVLVLCLWKVTEADIAPDVLFTVTISSALMFCVNLFVIGALMGDLWLGPGPMEIADANDRDWDDEVELVDDGETTNALTPIATETNFAASRRVAAVSQKPKTSSVMAPISAPAPVAEAEHFRSVESLPAKISLKGLAVNSARKTAMISAGNEFHTLGVGDKFSIPTGKGSIVLTCEDITAKAVILALNGSERVKLTF